MFNTVNLEMSIKPFKKTDDEYIRRVCRNIFEQWRPLIKNRKTVSVMLWTADGSELLDYTGNPEDTFDWCCYIGNANRELIKEGEELDVSPHERKQFYIENPPVMSYGILKRIVECIKDEGKKVLPKAHILVGTTLDCGPEFAVSDFKYNRHREATAGQKMLSFGGLDAMSVLNGDTRQYAAYPNGIPDKTPFTTFFGAQANAFMSDMGFDYLWLSNGLGYGANPWYVNGKIFDGEKFHMDKLNNTRDNAFAFWSMFRETCPDFPLEGRGTNYSVGIDYATDGVPLYDIYNADLNMSPPPNSPLAALYGTMGLELMGYMTRICELPSEGFMFRFYLHDPWWANSPWYDRYNGSPHDIYLPMSISRIDSSGKLHSATKLNLLTIDNSFGNLPDICANEVIPHILKAEKDTSDAVAPLVWVYPMREYSTAVKEEQLFDMYHGDLYISEAINNGLPLNCVVSTDNFLKTDLSIYKGSVLISPYPENIEVENKLLEFTRTGGNVLYYGSLERIKNIKNENAIYVDFSDSPSRIRECLKEFGYHIEFECKSSAKYPATMTVSRSDNAFMFSVYNPDTTTDTLLKFPLGAPVFIGGEIEINDSFARYRFSRSEHRECRVFVKQKSGVVSVKEDAPVSSMYHRLLSVFGFEDATVYIFPEADTKTLSASFWYGDETPKYDDSFKRVEDEKYGTYYYAEHVTGVRRFLFPFKDKL